MSAEDDMSQHVLQGMFRYGWIAETEIQKTNAVRGVFSFFAALRLGEGRIKKAATT